MRMLTPILLTLILAAPAFGQAWCGQGFPTPLCEAPAFMGDGPGPHGPGGPGRPGGPGGPGDWGEGPPRKMVEGFRLFKLTEYLALSEDQTAKVYPRIAEMNRLQEAHREQMQAKMKELGTLVDDEKNAEAAKLAMEIHKMRGDFQALMHGKQGELMQQLSEEQQAKYVLFEPRFEGHLREVAERLHGRLRDRLDDRDDRPGDRMKERMRDRMDDERGRDDR